MKMGKVCSRATAFAFALCLMTAFVGTLTGASYISAQDTAVDNIVFPGSIKYPSELIPLGKAVGIKMYSDGVIVAGIADVETADGTAAPLSDAGIKVGDILVSINGNKIASAEGFERLVSSFNGNPVTIEYLRDGKTMSAQVTPAKSSTDGKYRVGAWIRDSMAGVGTISFVDPASGTFGALGHAICDIDTGKLMPLRSGSIMPATVTDVKKGEIGSPGELRCAFDLKHDIGTLISNTNRGIFGNIQDASVYEGREALPIADSSEIEPGKAYIYSTVNGTETKTYEIEITKLYRSNNSDEKNMMIKITDPELIEKTGGIVQGMSGSPIIQNGKIIGAVTHVLVNDPRRGYGIFIQNMLNKAYQMQSAFIENAA